MAAERISIDLDTSDPAITRLERHSYVNLINVIHAELQLVERMIDAPGALRSTIHLAEAASRAFKELRAARRHLGELVRFGELVESDLAEALAEAGEKADADDVREAASILLEVLPDANLRVQEVIARHRLPRPAVEYQKDELQQLLASSGTNLSVSADAETVWLPIGTGRVLSALASGGGACRVTEAGVQQHSSTIVQLGGTGSIGYLAPLTQHLKPSELHAVLAGSGQPLRGMIQLAYFTVPSGSAQLRVDRADGDRAAFTLELELAAFQPEEKND